MNSALRFHSQHRQNSCLTLCPNWFSSYFMDTASLVGGKVAGAWHLTTYFHAVPKFKKTEATHQQGQVLWWFVVILLYTCTILGGLNCLLCFQNSLEWKTWSKTVWDFPLITPAVCCPSYYSSCLLSIVTHKNVVGFHLVTIYTNIAIFFLSFFPPTTKWVLMTRITVLHFTLMNTTTKSTLISGCQILSWFVRKSNCTGVDNKRVLNSETDACNYTVVSVSHSAVEVYLTTYLSVMALGHKKWF